MQTANSYVLRKYPKLCIYLLEIDGHDRSQSPLSFSNISFDFERELLRLNSNREFEYELLRLNLNFEFEYELGVLDFWIWRGYSHYLFVLF